MERQRGRGQGKRADLADWSQEMLFAAAPVNPEGAGCQALLRGIHASKCCRVAAPFRSSPGNSHTAAPPGDPLPHFHSASSPTELRGRPRRLREATIVHFVPPFLQGAFGIFVSVLEVNSMYCMIAVTIDVA